MKEMANIGASRSLVTKGPLYKMSTTYSISAHSLIPTHVQLPCGTRTSQNPASKWNSSNTFQAYFPALNANSQMSTSTANGFRSSNVARSFPSTFSVPLLISSTLPKRNPAIAGINKNDRQCGLCKRTFQRPSALKVHMRTHNGEKPYKCKFCLKAFSQIGNLTVHIRKHTGEKPYKCSICHRAFSQSSSFNVHFRTHTGEKPFQCMECSKRFTYRSTFLRHSYAVHKHA